MLLWKKKIKRSIILKLNKEKGKIEMTTNEYKVKKIELNNEEKELYDYLIKEKNEHPLLAKYIAKKEHINKSNLEIYLNPVLRNLDDSNKIKDLNK